MFSHFAYGDIVLLLKCVWHLKHAIFRQNFVVGTLTLDGVFDSRAN